MLLPPGNRLIIYTIYPCPVSFCPLDSFYPHVILPPIILPPPLPLEIVECTLFKHVLYHFAPWKLFHDLHYLPMSRIILPPGFILPTCHFAPSHFAPLPLEIFECTLFTHVLYHFAPWKLFHDLHYLPMSRIILPLDSFCPHILPPGNGLMIYTIYSCPVSFCHCIRLLFHTNKKPFTTKA